MKKVFIFSTSALILLGIVFIAYNFTFNGGEKKLLFSNSNNSSETKKDSSKRNDNAEDKQNPFGFKKDKKENENVVGIVEKVSDKPVLFPKIEKDGVRIKYYSKKDEGFWEVSFDGSLEKKISNENMPDLKAIIWSTDGKKIILKRGDGFYRYYYNNGQKNKIKDKANFMVWSNLGDKIIYDYIESPEAESKTINIANPDGSEWKVLAKVKNRKSVIAMVPQSSLISFWNVPKSTEESDLQVISVAGGKVQYILSGKFGADYLWSPDGEKFLVSSVVNKGGDTMVLEVGKVDFDGESPKVSLMDLRLPTLASKCVWSKDSKTIYCALLTGVPDNAVMPDDYYAGKFYTDDYFWKVNTETGKKERLVKLEDMKKMIDATDLFLSPNEDMLFFVNRKDGELYKINL